jgi:hypothetical protein
MDNHNMDLPLLSVLQAGSICVTAVTAVVEAVEEERQRKRPKTDHRTLSLSQDENSTTTMLFNLSKETSLKRGKS